MTKTLRNESPPGPVLVTGATEQQGSGWERSTRGALARWGRTARRCPSGWT